MFEDAHSERNAPPYWQICMIGCKPSHVSNCIRVPTYSGMVWEHIWTPRRLLQQPRTKLQLCQEEQKNTPARSNRIWGNPILRWPKEENTSTSQLTGSLEIVWLAASTKSEAIPSGLILDLIDDPRETRLQLEQGGARTNSDPGPGGMKMKSTIYN